MAHTFVRNHIHIVFGTRERRPFIKPALEEKLWAYIRGIARNYDTELEAIGGMPDHIHLLVAIPAKLSVADAVRVLKANSSKWMNESGHLFGWQKGYAAVSVSASNLKAVMEYIRNQPAHHAKRSFKDEYIALLRKYGVNVTPEEAFD